MRIDTTETGPAMRRWRGQVFGMVWIAYFSYYLCRYNMPMAKTRLCEAFHWNAPQFGMVLSALLVAYAVGQFISGQLADRFGARQIASLGAAGSVLMNLLVFAVLLFSLNGGLSSNTVLWALVILWGANGFFQAMGWPPMVRIMAHWFPTSTRGKIMGWLGTCYQLGAAFSWFLALFIIRYYADILGGDWRAVFLVPAGVLAGVGVLFFVYVRNAPEDVGLRLEDGQASAAQGHVTLSGNVLRTLRNPYLWVVAGTFFLLDVNRYGFVNWLPSYLDKRDVAMGAIGFGTQDVISRCIHPLAGGLGAVLAGWATDRFFGGRRAPVIAILLLLLGVFSIVFPYLPSTNTGLMVAVLAMIGFCTYGPHILMVGHAAQDFGKKSGAAGAAGFIDGMGYIGASLAGYGAGLIIEAYGYEVNFVIFGMAAILGALLIGLLWTTGPDHSSADTGSAK